MTSLWGNVSVNVVASCLLNSALKVHEECNRLLPDWATYLIRCIGLCAHGTCLSTFLNENYQQMLERNNNQLITLQIWMEWRCRVWGATHEAILKPSSEARNSFWIKSHSGAVGQVSWCCAALTNETCMSVCCAALISSELVGPAWVQGRSSNPRGRSARGWDFSSIPTRPHAL